jgi:hypothetical protein
MENLKMQFRQLLVKYYAISSNITENDLFACDNMSESELLANIDTIESKIKYELYQKLNIYHRRIYGSDDFDAKYDLDLSLSDYEELFYRRMIEYSIIRKNKAKTPLYNYRTPIDELEKINKKL